MQPAGLEKTDLHLDGQSSTASDKPLARIKKESLPEPPIELEENPPVEFEDTVKRNALARSLGMVSLSFNKRNSLYLLGNELTRAGILEVGRGMYLMGADRIEFLLKLVKKQLRLLDAKKRKNADGQDTPVDAGLRQDFMKLFREFTMAGQKIAVNMVESDRATREGQNGEGVPSFRPGAAVSAVQNQQQVNITINKEKE